MNDTSLSCAFFGVPLDYQDPSVGNARLAMIKINATEERRGTVLFNPGMCVASSHLDITDRKCHRRTWRTYLSHS